MEPLRDPPKLNNEKILGQNRRVKQAKDPSPFDAKKEASSSYTGNLRSRGRAIYSK